MVSREKTELEEDVDMGIAPRLGIVEDLRRCKRFA
jgi:hypothetical protein